MLVAEVPSDESPKRGLCDPSVVEESTVVAPQVAVFPLIVAERDRITIGATTRRKESTRARAQTAVAFVPSDDIAMAEFFEWKSGAERSVTLPHETVVPDTVPVLDFTIRVRFADAADQTTVTAPPDAEIPKFASSMQLPRSETRLAFPHDTVVPLMLPKLAVAAPHELPTCDRTQSANAREPSADRTRIGWIASEVMFIGVIPPHDAMFPVIVAALLCNTVPLEESLPTHIATALEPSEDVLTEARRTLISAAERVEIGPHVATPPEIVPELVFTR